MAKTYRPYVPEQDLLLPPSLRDWLPEDHLAFFVSDLIDQLDLSAITAVYEDEERGYPPYHPVMLTKVLVYAYCVGVFSSRKIQRRLVEDVAFRVLAAGNEPDFRTIADFRKTHLATLTGLFEQVLRLARELGAPRVGRVALDGSKIKANASKHKAMSYDRMRAKQQQLREEVSQLLAQAEAVDAAEDAEYGTDRRGDELPAELQRRDSRLKRIREAKRALETRAKDEATAKGEPAESAKPDPKAQYNFTDPESRIMKGPDGFVQAYNVQVAVNDLQLIVGQAVTQETNDKKQLLPMITAIEQQSGDTPSQLLADAGYCSDENLTALADTTIDAYISTRKQKHGERPGPCPRGPLPQPATHGSQAAHESRGEGLRGA
jgi:transposase